MSPLHSKSRSSTLWPVPYRSMSTRRSRSLRQRSGQPHRRHSGAVPARRREHRHRRRWLQLPRAVRASIRQGPHWRPDHGAEVNVRPPCPAESSPTASHRSCRRDGDRVGKQTSQQRRSVADRDLHLSTRIVFTGTWCDRDLTTRQRRVQRRRCVDSCSSCEVRVILDCHRPRSFSRCATKGYLDVVQVRELDNPKYQDHQHRKHQRKLDRPGTPFPAHGPHGASQRLDCEAFGQFLVLRQGSWRPARLQASNSQVPGA